MPRRKTQGVTLNDIANKLKVSVAVVSRALNGEVGVGEELAKKIKSTAEEMGYDYHPFRSKRSDTIGLLFAVKKGTRILPPFMSKLVIYLNTLSEKTGKYFLVHVLDQESNSLPSFISNKRIDGALMAGHMPREYYSIFKKNSIPVVTINDSSARTGCNSVLNNPYDATEQLVERLADLGHQNMSLVGTSRIFTTINRRFEAWNAAIHKFKMNPDPRLVIEGRNLALKSMHEYAEGFIKSKHRPSAVVFTGDVMAFNACTELRLKGVSIPSEVSIAGFDNDPIGEEMTPGLTTIDVKLHEVAQTALELLLENISSPTAQVVQKEVNAELVWRSSCIKCK